MSRDNTLLRKRISKYLILEGELFNVSSKTKSRNRILHRAIYGKGRYSNSTWHNSIDKIRAFTMLIEKGVPVWFLRRYATYITNRCLWIRGGSWYESYHSTGDLIRGTSYSEVISIANELSDDYSLISNISFPEKIYEDNWIMHIEGASSSNGVYVGDILKLWVKMRDRFLAIHGNTCANCKKKYYNRDVPMESVLSSRWEWTPEYHFSYAPSKELMKHQTTICSKCMKVFVDLDFKTKKRIEEEKILKEKRSILESKINYIKKLDDLRSKDCEWVTPKEIAEVIGNTAGTVRSWIKNRDDFPNKKPDSERVYVSKLEVISYLNNEIHLT